MQVPSALGPLKGESSTPSPQIGNMPSETNMLMALAEMHKQGAFDVAANDSPTDQPIARALSIRSQASLNRAINNADSDEELQSIKDRLEKRGYDTSHPAFQGLK